MSNEELVAEIQAGATERMGELWEQVAGLVKWKAKRIMTVLEGCPGRGVEFEDLCQSGYLATVAAVNTYDPDTGGDFSTWLMYHLQNEFAVVTGYRTKRGRSEPLNNALSIDTPLSDDADSALLGDLIPDHRAAATMQGVEEREYQRQLKHAIDRVLAELPTDIADVLRLRHYDRLTLDEIGERRQLSRARIRQMENKGIRKLREPRIACTLRPFMDFDFYSCTGLSAFRKSGQSVQERYVLMEEERRERRRKVDGTSRGTTRQNHDRNTTKNSR